MARSPERLSRARYRSAATLALGVGVICAWYETSLLIGPLPSKAVAAGFGLEVVWVCFCIGVVAAWASIARGVPAVAGASLGSLLVLVFLSSFRALSSWSPSALAASVADLVRPGHTGVPWHAFAITMATTLVLISISVWRLARRGSWAAFAKCCRASVLMLPNSPGQRRIRT